MMFRFLSQPPEKILEKAAKLNLEGKLDKAISLLEQGAEEHPQNFQILTELGSLYFQTDQYKSACTLFKKAQRASPSAESALLPLIESLHLERGKPAESGELLLEIYIDRRQLEDAERVASSLTQVQLSQLAQKHEQMLSTSAKYPTAHLRRNITLAYSLATLHAALHDYPKSFAMFEKIVTLSSSEWQCVIKEAKRIAAKEWGNALLAMSLGDLYARRGMMEEVAEHYMRVVEFDATKSNEVMERIRSLLQKSESEPLARCLTQLCISTGRFDEALALIGRLEKLQTKREEITRLYTEVARLAPSSPRVHMVLGGHFFQEGKHDSATAEYLKAAELDTAQADTILGKLEDILAKEPAHEYTLDASFDICLSNMRLDRAVEMLGKAYETDRGLADSVVEKLAKVLEKDISSVHGLALLATIHHDRGDLQKTISILSYLCQIGEGGARACLPLLEMMVEKEPELVEARVALADTHGALGDFDKALLLYFESLDARPDLASSIIPKVDAATRERRSLALRAASLYGERKYLDPLVLHYSRAEACAVAGSYLEAIEELKWCVENHPDHVGDCVASYQRMLIETEHADVRLALGDAYFRIGKANEALEEYSKAASADEHKFRQVLDRLYKLKGTHDTPRIRSTIIDLLVRNRLHSQAAEEIDSSLKAFPAQRGSFLLALARIKQDRGNFEEAVVHAKDAMEDDHTLAPSVIETLKRQEQMGTSGLPCLRVLARAYQLTREYDRAAEELKKIADRFPDVLDWTIDRLHEISRDDPANPRPPYVRGQLLLVKGRIEDAIEDFSRAAHLDTSYLDKIQGVYRGYLRDSPANPHVLLALARACIERESFTDAAGILAQLRGHGAGFRGPVMRELTRIVEKSPKSRDALRTLTELYMEDGKYEPSLDLLNKLIDLGDSEVPWVMQQLHKIDQRDPANPRCLRTMGRAYLRMKDLEHSCHIYDRLLEVEGEELSPVLTDVKAMAERYPDNTAVLFLHSRTLLRKGFTKEACDSFRELVNLDPAYHHKVMDELESVKDFTPEPESLHLLLGELLQRAGENDRAIDVLQTGLKRAQHGEQIVEMHILLANAHHGMKDERHAAKAIKMARSRAQSKEAFFARLAVLQNERIGFEIARLQSSLKDNPEDDSKRLQLARLLRENDKISEALETLRFQPTELRAKKRRAIELSLCLTKKGELSTAIDVLNAIPVSDPPEDLDCELLYALARLYARMGQPLLSIACLKNIRRVLPEYREASTLLRQEYAHLLRLQTGLAARTIIGGF